MVEGYHAVVTAMDDAIGRVLATVDSLKLADDTFVFFYSDNGAFMLEGRGLECSTNAPFREGGVTCWEGGLRVAAMARWPGKIEAGGTIDESLWSPDLLVACTRLANVDLPDGLELDGKNPLPVLTEGAASPHHSMYFSFRKHTALRKGDWKIVRTRPEQDWMLFNLASDPGERSNVAGRKTDVLNELVIELQQWEGGF